MGKDKFESNLNSMNDLSWDVDEELIKYAWEEDIWFHVDKYSSAHVYLRLSDRTDMSFHKGIPEDLLAELAQLVKANSIEGNKKDNLTIIYTPASNLKKTGEMDVGTVSFHKDNLVKRVFVQTRVNAIVNRLNKTKVEKNNVDFEQEKVQHEKKKRSLKWENERKQVINCNYISFLPFQREEKEKEIEAKRKEKAESGYGYMEDETRMTLNTSLAETSINDFEENFM